MSWRWWAALLGVCALTAGACSGKSDSNDDDVTGGHGGSAAGGAGGTAQGHAGEQADLGSGDTSSGGATTLTVGAVSGTGASFGTTVSTSASVTDSTSGSVTGSTTATSAGGTTGIPGWTCLVSAYDDGSECHCGCGIVDPDCEDASAGSCDVCSFHGSCAGGACPSSIDEHDNSRCDVPEGWTCAASLYGNGVCHCGCGVVDMDCASASRDDCEVCWAGCTGEGCPGPIDAENNAICTGISLNWTCSERFWRDGLLCHCGCGALDPDCGANAIDAIENCDRCDFEGSCSAGECPGTIDPDHISTCDPPDPPAEWVCYAGFYADGTTCHCGCGAVDLDCPDASIASCQNCEGCGYPDACDITIDPEDIASCRPTPPGWECSDYTYGDGYADGYACHCGCGVIDPDCESLAGTSCDVCSVEYGSCADDYGCTGIDPDDNTRCVDDAPPEWNCDPDTYGDEACDCGCGARDLDCASESPSACDFCDAEGSCSDAACSDLAADDNAVCVTEEP